MARTHQWTDQQVEITISTFLRFGVTLAVAIVVVGSILYLVHHGYETPEERVFRGEPADLRPPGNATQCRLCPLGLYASPLRRETRLQDWTHRFFSS
ncbi:DUF1634 domain-containing protein [Scytonema sp. NUACC26]|uniref:DUF1634 domain-containing protein n=1 Tax=Scytonema sp. NUACC26 TaxID=3140176 RepID=UPI0034DBF000